MLTLQTRSRESNDDLSNFRLESIADLPNCSGDLNADLSNFQ
jgi:hypothetical protein